MDAPKEPIKEATPPEPEGATTFEKVVVGKGWATPEQVEAAVKHRAEKKALGELISLSQALVSLGTITPARAREALGMQEKMSMRCPTCRKVFNVWGKPGARTLCQTCKVALVPTGASFPIPAEPLAAPAPTATAPVSAADAVDASLASLVPGYRIVRRLGSGGMGDVFQALQISLDRAVALKLLPVELAKDKVFVERFLSEARAAGKMTHENIVAAVDVGEANGRYYFVMELVEGPTLQQVIQREGALLEDRALAIAGQISRGLRHAYQQNLIHRDIKPANVMIAAGNVAKICDFGLARDLNTDVTLTMPGLVQSSPAYASPEQCRGRRDLDHRTDMYSLGVTLFEMLTGKRPFQGDTPGALFIKHATEAPPSPQSLNTLISPAASQLVLRLLKKEPKQRFDTYDQLIQAIDVVQKTKAPRPAAAKSSSRPSTVRRVAAPKSNPVLIGLAAAVLLLGVAGFLFFRTPAGSAIKKASTTEPAAKAKPATDSEADRLLLEMSAQERRTEDEPSEIPAARGRWKQLAEKYRGTPTFPVIIRRQADFEAKVSAMAEALAVQTLTEAQNRRQAGRPAEAFLLLRGFPSLYDGTEAASRIAGIAEETGKAIEETFMSEREKVLAQLAAGKVEEAVRALGPLKALVSGAAADGTVDFIRADFREHYDKLTARIHAVSKPSQPKPDNSGGGGGSSEPLVLPTAKAIDRGPVSTFDYVQVLKSPDLRANAQERARAAAAFRALAPRSALCRAMEVFLARDDKFWKLAPGTKQFGEYLASLPLERADALSTAEHAGLFVGLAKKISEPGDAPKDLLALFALAHVDDLLAQNVRPDPEGIRLSKFTNAKSVDFWGPPATVNRLALARAVASGSGPVDLKRAIEAASTSVDFPTRYLTALAAFREPEFDPTAGVATWKRLAAMAPETPGCRHSDMVAERIKKALPCDGCNGLGRYACKKCQAQGMADCDRCKGSGRVKENADSNFAFGYTVPCPVCKQKGKLLCPICQGGKVQKCEKCDGKKVKKTLPSSDFADVLSAYVCNACGGTGSVFPRTAYPCPDCEGFSRFPSNVSMAPSKTPEAAGPRVSPVPAVPDSPAAEAGDLQRGLMVQGYLGEKFETLAHTQVSSTIDFQFNVQDGRPAAWPGGPSEHFSLRWTGWLRVQEPGKYFFKAISDDGVRLFIDDVQIFEDWDPHAPRQAAAMVDLTKGQHKIRVDYYNGRLSGAIALSWQPPSASAPVVIPSDAFRCPKK